MWRDPTAGASRPGMKSHGKGTDRMNGRGSRGRIRSRSRIARLKQPRDWDMHKLAKTTIALASTLLTLSCASTQKGPTTAVDVHIENNLIPPSMVTVYFVPEAGIERMIGTVVPS